MLTGRDRDAVDADLLGAASRGESGPARRWVTLRGALALAVAAGTLAGMATAVPAHATEEDAEPVRIMPFGDSITQGSAGDHTWRWFLDRHLRASGQEFDFVGPRHSVASLEGWAWETGYAEEDFDQDHAGWWGNSMVWPLDPGVRTLMEEFRPQVVVLNGSANDVGFWNESADRVLERLRRWVAAAREVNPGTAFVLSEMTIDDAPGYAELNAWLPFLAQELDEESSPVVLARAAEGFVPASGPGMPADTWDTKHPNTSGSQKIAAAVADALAELGVGTPYPRPLAAVDEAPVQVPHATAEVLAPGSVRLSWDVVPGATSVRVEHRSPAAQQAWDVLADWVGTRDDLALDVEDLPECVEHQFRIRAEKGWTIASERYASDLLTYRWSRVPEQAVTLRRSTAGGTSTGGTSTDGISTVAWEPVEGECSAEVVVRRPATPDMPASEYRVVVEGSAVTVADPPAGATVVVEVTPLGVDARGRTSATVWSTPAPPPEPTPTPTPTAPPTAPPTSTPTAPPTSTPTAPTSTPNTPPTSTPRRGPVVKAPSRVQRPVLVKRSRVRVRIRWKDVSGDRGYEVRARSAGGKWKVVARTARDGRQVVVRNLRPGRAYRVQVRAVGPSGARGAWSPVRVVRTRR